MTSHRKRSGARGEPDWRAEAERWREEAELLRLALNTMPAAVAVVDEEGRPQVYNPAAERVLGMGAPGDTPPAEWSARYGTYYADGVTPYPSEKLPIIRAVRGEEADEPDMLLRNPGRDGVWLSASARPLRDAAGRLRGAVLVCHDVTERKQAEQQIRLLNAALESRVRERTSSLEEANRQLRREGAEKEAVAADLRRAEAWNSALIESTTDSVWSVDRNYALVTTNSALRANYPQAIGRPLRADEPFERRAPRKIAPAWRRRYDRVLAGEHLLFEHQLELDGVTRHYVVSMSPIRVGGEIIGATAFSRDVTALRALEAEARRNQAELVHVLRLGTLGEIAAGLAHEINQPLCAIANFASACTRRLDQGALSEEMLREGLALVADEAVRAGEIIKRLRQIGGRGDGRMADIDVNAVVAHAVQLMRPELGIRGIELRVETASSLPRPHADPVLLEQVVLNLLLNAVEAVQDCPVKQVSLHTAADDAGVEVSVRDSGPGIDRDQVNRLFEPFFTTKPNGLGMGLAISHRIVSAHGGRLWGRRGEDGGSIFGFSLPAAKDDGRGTED